MLDVFGRVGLVHVSPRVGRNRLRSLKSQNRVPYRVRLRGFEPPTPCLPGKGRPSPGKFIFGVEIIQYRKALHSRVIEYGPLG
jgi:hypothetical protein